MTVVLPPSVDARLRAQLKELDAEAQAEADRRGYSLHPRIGALLPLHLDPGAVHFIEGRGYVTVIETAIEPSYYTGKQAVIDGVSYSVRSIEYATDWVPGDKVALIMRRVDET